jgi:hypothetical protein
MHKVRFGHATLAVCGVISAALADDSGHASINSLKWQMRRTQPHSGSHTSRWRACAVEKIGVMMVAGTTIGVSKHTPRPRHEVLRVRDVEDSIFCGIGPVREVAGIASNNRRRGSSSGSFPIASRPPFEGIAGVEPADHAERQIDRWSGSR